MSDADGPGADAPRIEFPCDYPVKIMGADEDGFVDLVTGIAAEHAPELRDPAVLEDAVRVRRSSGGRWASVTIVIRATGEAQLRSLFEALKATGRIQLVL